MKESKSAPQARRSDECQPSKHRHSWTGGLQWPEQLTASVGPSCLTWSANKICLPRYRDNGRSSRCETAPLSRTKSLGEHKERIASMAQQQPSYQGAMHVELVAHWAAFQCAESWDVALGASSRSMGITTHKSGSSVKHGGRRGIAGYFSIGCSEWRTGRAKEKPHLF